MQTVLRVALAIYLAHLFTDFVFQNSRIIELKQSGRVGGYLRHGGIHYVSAILIGGFFLPGAILSMRFQVVVLALTLLHLAIDFGKIRMAQAHLTGDGTLPFVGDQLLHAATVGVAAWFIAGSIPLSALILQLSAMRGAGNRILLAMAVYVGVIFAGGYLIRSMTRPLMTHVRVRESHSELTHAGMYIGWLERFLVLTALLLHSPATVGLIIAAKSIARYPEFRNEQFAEYFLIGTLLSISIAILGGVILQKVFYGNLALPA
ncbi:MAG: DUF3307 domain-containing protein [Candidatus Acidiferrales bacterium]